MLTQNRQFFYICYHVVILPQYKEQLRPQLENRLRELFHNCASTNQWHIKGLNIQYDYVYLQIQCDPTWSVSKIVTVLKRGTDKIIKKEMPDIDHYLFSDRLWRDGFLVTTDEILCEKDIKQYIQDVGKN